MRGHLVSLLGICLLTFFAGLGSPAIADSDEAFYAESAREMVESGDWLTPHFNYVYRFEKPVLYYWLAASSYLVAGVSEAAARFPSALAGVGLTLLAFAAARRRYDPPTGFLAGVITATSFGYVAMARQALPDLTLAFFVTLSTWAALVAWLEPSTQSGERPDGVWPRTAWVVISAVGAAGAILTKGPIGLVLPALVVGPLVAWESWVTRSRPTARLADLAIFAIVVLVLSAPWYLGMTLVHGAAYLDRFFIAENLDRFATSRYNDPRPFWYYAPIVVGGLLPWSPFMLLWAPAIARGMRQRLDRSRNVICFAWWAVAPLLFYSLSVGKQPRYILPILPPLAVLLAHAIRSQLDTRDRGRLFEACTGIAAALLCAVAALVYRAAPLLVEWEPVWIASVAAAIALSGVGVLLTMARPRWTLPAVVIASILVSIGGHAVVLSSPGTRPVERVAEIVNDARQNDEPYGRYQVLHRNLIFYTRAPFRELGVEQAVADFLRSPERVVTVLPAEAVSRLEAQRLPLLRLGEVRYLNTGGLTFQTLLDPDPDRYLHRVVVIANRE